MASWTERDLAYLRSNPHSWSKFESHFGSLPEDFTKPGARDLDIQYLKQNPDAAPKFKATFGYLPEGFEAPEEEQLPVEEPAMPRENIAPPEEISEAAKKAAKRWQIYGPGTQVPQMGGGGPGLVDVPDEHTIEELRKRNLREDGKPLFEAFFDSVKGVFTRPPAELDNEQIAEAEQQIYNMGYRGAGLDFVEAKTEERKREGGITMGSRDKPGYGVPVGTTDEPEEEDGLGKTLWGFIKTVPDVFRGMAAGFEAVYAANKRVHGLQWYNQLAYLADQEGKALVDSTAIQTIAAQRGVTEEDVVEELFTAIASAAESEQEALEWHARIREETQNKMPKVVEGSAKYYAGAITQAFLTMGPAMAGGILTRNPNMTLALMGTQVFGDQYAEARNEGRTHGQAVIDGMFYAASETVVERIPLGVAMSAGKGQLLKKILKAGATEGMEEMINEALQMGYEMGILSDDITLGEALVRLKHSGIIGAGVGIKMAMSMHPFVKDNADPKSVPPQLREFVEAHQQLKSVVERAADPTQKVTKAELTEARERYDNARNRALEAKDNPEYEALLNEQQKLYDEAASELIEAKRKDAALPGVQSKQIAAAEKKLAEAEQRIRDLIVNGPPAEAPEPQAVVEPPMEEAPPAPPEVSDLIGGTLASAMDQLAKHGANAELPDGTAKQLIDAGLAKETPAGGLMVLPEGRRKLKEWKENRHETVINVGLDVSDGSRITPEEVKSALDAMGIEILSQEGGQSRTEPTTVVTLARPLTKEEGDALSATLKQEAIPQRSGDKGSMFGPMAAKWGDFDPREFLEPTKPKPGAAKAKPAEKAAEKPAKKAKAEKKTFDINEALKPTPEEAAPVEPASAILEPEKAQSLSQRPTPTEADVAALQKEMEADPARFDLRTAEMRATIGADVAPVTRMALEAAVDARTKVKAEAEAIDRAEQENAAYARRERQKAKAEAKKNRELEEMIRGQKDAEADEAIALAEFLNKQESEDSSPGVLAAALKQAYADLSSREERAMARLRERAGRPIQGQLFDLGGAIAEGSKLYKDLVEVGALKIAKGLVRFADWSAAMVNDFGKRITPHLQKLYGDSRAAAENAVQISHKQFKSGSRKGQIVAAPPTAKTPAAVTKLRTGLLKALALEGEPGKFWYERSGKAVLDMVGGDKAEARLFAGLLALYSQGTALAPNTTVALKVWNQWKANEPIQGATKAQDKKAVEWLETGVEGTGLKISNFYNNLMREIDPANYDVGQGATIDLWMVRAFGYERDVPTDAQYVFAQTEIKKLAKALGWEPQQAQAAIWVAIKARWEMIREAGRREAIRKGYASMVPEGKDGRMILKANGDTKTAAANQRKINNLFRKLALKVADSEVRLAVQSTKSDYLDELKKHVAIVSWGSAPSSKLGQTMLDATFAEKLEFQAEIERIMINPDTGREIIAEMFGIIGNESFSGIGAWDMNIGATRQDQLLAPPEGGTGAPNVDVGASRLISAYTATIGYLLQLDAVSWHRPFFAANLSDSNAIDVDLKRQLTAEEVDRVYRAFYQNMKETFGLSHEQAIKYAPIPTPYGFRVINHNSGVANYQRKKDDADFQSTAEASIREVFPLDDIAIEAFRASGDLATNDWVKAPNGESYVSRVYQVKNTEVHQAFERAKRELSPRIEEARKRFEEKVRSRQRKGSRELDAPVSMDRIIAGGADAVAETYGRFGELTGRDTNLEQKIYDLSGLIANPDLVQSIADAYGYRIEYFSFESNPELGVQFKIPELKKKGYKQGYVWIYDPRNSHGSFKGSVEYTRAWRVSHEIAHGITEQFMQAKYGDSKRYGRLGRPLMVERGVEGKQVMVEERPLTLKEAQRAVEWEDVTFRAQRIILEQMGVKISDAQFGQENNINLADAMYRVLTGDFGNPGDFGFMPSSTPADIGAVLKALESAEIELAKQQGREPTVGTQFEQVADFIFPQRTWTRVSDAEIADAVARSRRDGMGAALVGQGGRITSAGIDATLTEPRVTIGVSGMVLPRKPKNAIRFRNFRPVESSKSGVKTLKVKPSKDTGDISTNFEYILDVPLAKLYNATKDPKSLRGNLTQGQFEAEIARNGFAGFYQTAADGTPKGSVSLFERPIAKGMQDAINRVAANTPKVQTPKLSVSNPGGEWLAGKIETADKYGRNANGAPKSFGTVTASLRGGTVLMPLSKISAVPGIMGEQQNVRQRSLEWLKSYMGETGRLPIMRSGEEYAPFIQIDKDGNAWVNEGNHRIMAAKELGWTHIPVEVRWFNGGEKAGGQFSPEVLLKEHEDMASKPRLPMSRTKVNRMLKQWAKVSQSFENPLDNEGAQLVMLPGADGGIDIATVRPAKKISAGSLKLAMEMADKIDVSMTLLPQSLGQKSVAEVVQTREWNLLRGAGFVADIANNKFVRPAAMGSMFSVARGTNDGKGISLVEANDLAVMMRNLFPRAHVGVDIIAVESWEKLPADVRRGTPDGFSKKGAVEAVFYDPGPLDRPQVILISNNVANRGDAIVALTHEIVGHYGLRSVLGAGYQNYMGSVWTKFEKEAREAAARNGLTEIDSKDQARREDARNKAAEEFIAYLAGEIISGAKAPPAKIGFFEGIVRAVKQFLIRAGIAEPDARDIMHLINSSARFARGSVFAVREARRKAIMMSQGIPEFYSQMFKYINEKLPNAATPKQYLEQLNAALSKGQFKQEEMEVAAVRIMLDGPISLSQIAVENWHPDDYKRIGPDSAEVMAKAAALGSMAQADVAMVTKLTKAGLINLLETHAARPRWKLVRDAYSNHQLPLRSGGKDLWTISKAGPYSSRIEKIVASAGKPINALTGGLFGSRIKVSAIFDSPVKITSKLPAKVPEAAEVMDLLEIIDTAIVRIGDVFPVNATLQDIRSKIDKEGGLTFDPTSLIDWGNPIVVKYKAEAEKIIEEVNRRNGEILQDYFDRTEALEKYLNLVAENRGNKDFDGQKVARDMGIGGLLLDEGVLNMDADWARDSFIKQRVITTDTIIRNLMDRREISFPGQEDMSFSEYFTRSARVGDSGLFIESMKRTSMSDNRPHYIHSVIRDEKTGFHKEYDMGDVRQFTEDLEMRLAMIEDSVTIDPHQTGPYSTKWSSYTLREGLNAYQEWILIDDNPSARKYKRGHWGEDNAAHLRSGFVIDEKTNRLVPIGLEIQSDTGQAWQKDQKSPKDLISIATSNLRSVTSIDVGTLTQVSGLRPILDNVFGELYAKSHSSDGGLPAMVRLISEAVSENQMVSIENELVSAYGRRDATLVGDFAQNLLVLIKGAKESLELVRGSVDLSTDDGAPVRDAAIDIDSVLGLLSSEKVMINIMESLALENGTDSLVAASRDVTKLVNAVATLHEFGAFLISNEISDGADGRKYIDTLMYLNVTLSHASRTASTAAKLYEVVRQLTGRPFETPEGVMSMSPQVGAASTKKIREFQLRNSESAIKVRNAIDAIRGGNSIEAPAYAETASHQLMAIKHLVRQAVENNQDYVFFAPGEHSAVVAASATSVVKAQDMATLRVRMPFDSIEEMMAYYFVVLKKSSAELDSMGGKRVGLTSPWVEGMTQSEADAIYLMMAEIEGNFFEPNDPRMLSTLMNGSLSSTRAFIKEEIKTGTLSRRTQRLGSKAVMRQLGVKKQEYVFVLHSERGGMYSDAPVKDGDRIAEYGNIMAIFPLKESGDVADPVEVVSQLGFVGASLLKEQNASGKLANSPVAFEKDIETRINWTNPNTSLIRNLYEAGGGGHSAFVTARGLRTTYNTILPATVSKFAKQMGSTTEMRKALPVTKDGEGADINSFESEEMDGLLASWRIEGMPVSQLKDTGFTSPVLLALKVNDKMREAVRTTGFPMFSIKDGKTGNALFDSFASKVGPFGATKTLRDAWAAFTNRWADRTKVAMFDVFHGQKIAEEALGIAPDDMGYISMRLAAGSEAVVRSALEYGVPIWRDGATAIDETAGGFLDILAPLAGNADKLRAWELWMIANRAERLKGEGREKLFDSAEIAEVQAMITQRGWDTEFTDIAAKYADWKKKLLDFAEESGIINSQTRPLWEHSDHIPFYRALEGDVSGPFSGGAIADVKQQIQRLRGSDKNIGDPLQNIFMNIASLIDASMRNHAARLSITNLDGSGLITKHPQFQFTQAAVPLDQLRARLRAVGVNSQTLDQAGMRGIEALSAVEAPTGENVVSFFEDGKRQYYEVHDPLILTALKGVHPNPWSKMMAFLRVPKRVFTQSITLDPVFMARNWFRDMFHAFALGRDGAIPVVPGYDSTRGAVSSLIKDQKMRDMMSGGGSFDSGYVNAHDPAGMAKIIRGRLHGAGLVRNWTTGAVMSTFEFYRDLSSSIENSHRVMVYEKAIKAGRSHKLASYEARDIMDFSMRGAHPLIRFLAETVPFWNARLQGVYRTFRVAGPGQAGKAAALSVAGMVTRGALLTLASVALFLKNEDDDRWKELNDFEKNMYYHFFDVFEEGDHYALPKPFEIGAMFSTIPEIIMEGLRSDEPDAHKAAGRQFWHMVSEALNFAPDVQAIMPIAELAMNRDTFRDSPILTDRDRRLLPEDQDDYRISPALRSLAHAMPGSAPDALRSPKQLQHLVLGYTGTLGTYAVGMADTIWWRLNEAEAGLPPEKRPDEIVGIRSFVRNQPRKYPRALATMYDVLEDADRVHSSMVKAKNEDNPEREDMLERDNIELVIARDAMDSARNEIREINKEIREIHLDINLSPAKKRELIDELLKIRGEIAKDVYDWRPGGRENIEETRQYRKSIRGDDFTGMTQREQADTLDELGLTSTAGLVRSASLSPREIASLLEDA